MNEGSSVCLEGEDLTSVEDAFCYSVSLSLSIDDLEGKVKWLDNYQKVKQLQEVLVWIPVWERDKRAHVPEVNIQIQSLHLFINILRF